MSKIILMKARVSQTFILVMVLLTSNASFAENLTPPTASCDVDGSSYAIGNFQIDFLQTDKGCTMMTHAIDEPAAYRSVTLGARGIVQIFNKYDIPNGTNSNSTATRSYFVFPRKQPPSFIPPLPGDTNVKLVTASGDFILVKPGKRAANDGTGAVQPKVSSSSEDPDFQVTESSVISKTNGGGVEISLGPSSQTLLLDTGFAMGGVAFTKPTGTSTFIDWEGHRCTVLNRQIFNFANDDADLKWDDEELFRQLKANLCKDKNLALPDLASYKDLPVTMPDEARSPAGKKGKKAANQ